MGRKRDLVSRAANQVARPISAISKGRKKRFLESPRLAILMFHHVGDQEAHSAEERDLLMTTAELRRYLGFFKEHYLICTLHTAEQKLREGYHGKLLVISFDDGYSDFYEVAFPILRELNIPANQNVIVKYADEGRPGYMNWEQIRELAETGLIEFGSHTFDEHHLVDERPIIERLSREEILKDLELSRESFLKQLGAAPDILAWPYGAVPKSLSREDSKKLEIRFQLTTASGMNFQPVDFSRLKRFAALGFESPEKLDSIIRGYDALGLIGGRF